MSKEAELHRGLKRRPLARTFSSNHKSEKWKTPLLTNTPTQSSQTKSIKPYEDEYETNNDDDDDENNGDNKNDTRTLVESSFSFWKSIQARSICVCVYKRREKRK